MFKEEGFTIIETLIVISLIAVLFSFTFLNYWSMEHDLTFDRKMGEVLQTIRKSRDYAIASWYPEEFDTEEDFYGGYGVKFTTGDREYVLFADLNNEETFTSNSREVDVLQLGEGTKVEQIRINDVVVDHLYLVFRSPDLHVFFNGDSAIEGDLTAVIVIGSDTVDYEKEVRINPYGVPIYEK